MRDFQSVIGKETRAQCLEKWNGKPDILMACVGGGSNAMGIFNEFIDDEEIRLIGVEVRGQQGGRVRGAWGDGTMKCPVTSDIAVRRGDPPHLRLHATLLPLPFTFPPSAIHVLSIPYRLAARVWRPRSTPRR